MAGLIDPESIIVEGLPGIWSPVQWELSDVERLEELEAQTTASLLNVVDAPEAILRLLLQETEIVRIFEPPEDFDPDMQGEWDPEIATYGFQRPLQLIKEEHDQDYLYLEYKAGDHGYWSIEIEPEKVTIKRI